jgi:hypothetical protein
MKIFRVSKFYWSGGAIMETTVNRWTHNEIKKEVDEFEKMLLEYWERLEKARESYILLKNRNKL